MAKGWEVNEILPILNRVYLHFLERSVDPAGLIYYGAKLSRGECSVRDVVKDVCHSDEYRNLHFTGSLDEQVRDLYRRCLNREADDFGRQFWEQQARERGIGCVIDGLVDSVEYGDRFGDDTPPWGSTERFQPLPFPWTAPIHPPRRS